MTEYERLSLLLLQNIATGVQNLAKAIAATDPTAWIAFQQEVDRAGSELNLLKTLIDGHFLLAGWDEDDDDHAV